MTNWKTQPLAFASCVLCTAVIKPPLGLFNIVLDARSCNWSMFNLLCCQIVYLLIRAHFFALIAAEIRYES
ncbi:hypothetical protein K432DRAFT_386961 [Lepidopterella palustris CBS 459.81]|uniref:Uncharacterized protein n=1 Tax=Lepidopterella palustris CBS 459.81 TaxID=1314670 RepID=A0A8E2DZ10_9PEZI|nr:hypothetical protein K432DRAFT_386961 [Lepidopterella palustris CBS 459.81]